MYTVSNINPLEELFWKTFGGGSVYDDIATVADKQLEKSFLGWRQGNGRPTVHTRVAPSYGYLRDDGCRRMDDILKTFIALAVDKLENDYGFFESLSWNYLVATLKQAPFSETRGNDFNTRNNFTRDRVAWFRFNRSPNDAVIKQVKAWFANLIQDQEILDGTQISINDIAKIVATTGTKIDSLRAVFRAQRFYECTCVDFGFLRFPDIENPSVRLYRIKITAWSRCTRVGPRQVESSGIAGEFDTFNFGPRRSVLTNASKSAVRRGAQLAEDLLDDLY